MASSFRTNGKFRSALRALPEAARAEVARGLDDSVRTIQKFAAAMVPVATGRLRKALSSRGAIGKRKRGLEVEFGLRTKSLRKRAFYAPFVEYGTRAHEQNSWRFRGTSGARLGVYRKMKVRVPAKPPRPFFVPAVRAGIPIWRRNMRAALQRALRAAARG